MHKQLVGAFKEARADDVRAVVVTGAGRGFCVGQDLNEFGEAAKDIAGRLRTNYHPTIRSVRGLEKPVLAAVNGPAAGAGLSFACACDLRLAAESATFVPAFINIGLVPDMGGTFFVTRLLGRQRAFEWMTSGRRLSAQEALEWGLVSEVVAGRPPGRASSRVGRRAGGDADARHCALEAVVRQCADCDAGGTTGAGGSAAGSRYPDRGFPRRSGRLPAEAGAGLQGPLRGHEMEATSTPDVARTHPIRLIVNDDLQRNRLTVFFRLILAIPLLLWACSGE